MATNLDHSAPDDVYDEKTAEEQPEAAAQTKAGVRHKVITEKAHRTCAPTERPQECSPPSQY